MLSFTEIYIFQTLSSLPAHTYLDFVHKNLDNLCHNTIVDVVNCTQYPMGYGRSRNLHDIATLSLEQETVLPYLTYRLALEGARVIRMEHPVYGDPNRRVGENRLNEDRMYTYFLAINCQKEAITLDLGTPEGLEIFKKLLIELKVDVFATNQLPRNYKKLGIDYEMVKAIKPDIIWVGLTGFGPESNEAAYDPILQARAA